MKIIRNIIENILIIGLFIGVIISYPLISLLSHLNSKIIEN